MPAVKKTAPSLPKFTTIEEEAAVLLASAILWKARDQKGPPTAAELRRRAAIYKRWSLVYGATEQGLLAAAAAIEGPAAPPVKPTQDAVEKPKKPAHQTPTIRGKLGRGGLKNGPAYRVPPPRQALAPTPLTAAPVGPRTIPKPPPLRQRADID